MADFTIDVKPQIKEYLRVLSRAGTFGKIEKDVLEHLINVKLFVLTDVTRALIVGHILEGRSQDWIVNHVPGNRGKLVKLYLDVKSMWFSYCEEPLPEESKEK